MYLDKEHLEKLYKKDLAHGKAIDFNMFIAELESINTKRLEKYLKYYWARFKTVEIPYLRFKGYLAHPLEDSNKDIDAANELRIKASKLGKRSIDVLPLIKKECLGIIAKLGAVEQKFDLGRELALEVSFTKNSHLGSAVNLIDDNRTGLKDISYVYSDFLVSYKNKLLFQSPRPSLLSRIFRSKKEYIPPKDDKNIAFVMLNIKLHNLFEAVSHNIVHITISLDKAGPDSIYPVFLGINPKAYVRL